MKLYFLLLFLSIPFVSSTQNSIIESFSDLATLEFEPFKESLTKSIKFDKENSTIINERLDLDYKYLEQGNHVVANNSTKLIETILNRDSDKKHFITWGGINGPSVGFTIFESKSPHKILGQIYSRQIIVPGNGFIYSIEREPHNFYVKRKYQIKNDTITEIKQPFYGVNIDSYALKSLTLYEDKDLTKPIATIPKNGVVKILVAEETSEHLSLYLVQSSFGLVGWIKLEADQYRSKSVEGLYYYGG
jgi:S-adenosylmethionine hydrolase